MKRHPSQEQGFALIVVTALFVAFALLATAVIDRSNAEKQLNAVAETREKIRRISNAIIEYSVFTTNHPYPCPAPIMSAVTDPGFGVASTTGCDTIATTPAGITSLSNDGVTNYTVRGMVPVTTLAPYGIAPDDAFDAWNNRILYVVDSGMTLATPAASAAGDRPTVTENLTGETFRPPDFIVLSYGKDKLGATPKAAASLALPPISCPLDGTPRGSNCEDSGVDALAFLQGPINAAPNIDAGSYFDDILSFYGR
jgi:hypothetical protein